MGTIFSAENWLFILAISNLWSLHRVEYWEYQPPASFRGALLCGRWRLMLRLLVTAKSEEENSRKLLARSVSSNQKQVVKLFRICTLHSPYVISEKI